MSGSFGIKKDLLDQLLLIPTDLSAVNVWRSHFSEVYPLLDAISLTRVNVCTISPAEDIFQNDLPFPEEFHQSPFPQQPRQDADRN